MHTLERLRRDLHNLNRDTRSATEALYHASARAASARFAALAAAHSDTARAAARLLSACPCPIATVTHAAELASLADLLPSDAPLAVDCPDDAQQLQAVLSHPSWERVTHLVAHYAPAAWTQPIAQGAARHIRALCLYDAELTEAQRALVSDTSALPALESLACGQDVCGDALVDALVASGMAQQLKALHVDWMQLSDDGLRRMFQRSDWPRLEVLELECNPIGAGGVRALIDSGCLARLRVLTLGGPSVDDATGAALLGQPMPRLTGLCVSDAALDDRSIRALAHNTSLSALRYLRLPGNPLRSAHLVELAQAAWPGLEFLHLAESRLTGKGGVHALATSPLMRTLRHLCLDGAPLRAQDLAALSAHSARIEVLRVHGCGIDDAGIHALCAGSGWRRLVRLDLGWNDVTDDGLQALAHAPSPALQSVALRDNDGLTDAQACAAWLRSESAPALTELHLDPHLAQRVSEVLTALGEPHALRGRMTVELTRTAR